MSWLLLFDNANSFPEIDAFYPRTSKGRGSIIITTQLLHFKVPTQAVEHVKVNSLTPEEGAKILFQYLGRLAESPDENSVAKKISSEVEGLPLALTTIGSYICESQQSLSGFLELFNRTSSLWQTYATDSGHSALEKVFKISLDELDTKSRQLIDIMAFMSPDSIPEQMLYLEESSTDFQDDDLTRRAK